MPVGLQAELEHPFGLVLLVRYEPDCILVESALYYVCLYLADKTEFVGLVRKFLQNVIFLHLLLHHQQSSLSSPLR